MKPLVAFLFCGALASAGLQASAATITVFAAASLTDSLKEISTQYEKQTGDRIVLNLGASSTLARQIIAGAPADLFFSADEAKMDLLQKQGLIINETRKSRLSNTLVLVVAARDGASIRSPKDLTQPQVRRVALGDPKAVPIGVYAREYLERQKLWTAIEPKVVATENVRAALAAVEAGNADASIVFKTDALISKRVRVVFEIPAADSPRISYPVALVKGAKQPQAAAKLLAYLCSEPAGQVFQKYGFLLSTNSDKP